MDAAVIKALPKNWLPTPYNFSLKNAPYWLILYALGNGLLLYTGTYQFTNILSVPFMREKPNPENVLRLRQEAKKILSSQVSINGKYQAWGMDELRVECAIQQIMLTLQQQKIEDLENRLAEKNANADDANPKPYLHDDEKVGHLNVYNEIASPERFIKTITDNAPGLIFYWRKDLICTFANQRAGKWLGLALNEIIGHSMQEVFGDALFNSNTYYIQQALQGIKVQFERGKLNMPGLPEYVWIQYVPDIEDGEVKGIYSMVTDIAELKKAQLATEFEERDKEALINSSSDYICSVDVDYNIITANTAYKKIMEAVTGIPVRKGDNVKTGSGFDDTTWQLWEGFFKRALAGESFTVETSTKPENMEWEMWTECSFTPIVQNDTITGLACYSRDITERKKAGEALRNSEKKHMALLQNISDIIVLVDEYGNIQYVSSSVTATLGYDEKDLPGRNMFGLIHPDDQALAFVEFQRALPLPGFANMLEVRLLHKNGHYIYIEARGSNQLHNPLLQAILINCRDITERKASERAIAESYKNLQGYKFALDQSSMVFIADANGFITYVNDNLCRISKYAYNELIGTSPDILTSSHHPIEFFAAMWQTLYNGHVWRGQIKNKAKDGTYFWVDSTVTPFLDATGKPWQFLAIATDITTAKLAQDALQVSNERFQYVTEATFDAIWDWDMVEKTIFWGDGYNTLFGHEPGFHHYASPADFSLNIHPAERPLVLNTITNSLNNGSRYWSNGYRFCKSNGEYAYVIDKAIIVRNDDGNAIRMIGAMQDITERTKAVIELEQSELKFRSMVHNINDIITLVDESGLVLYSSPSLTPVLGYMPQEVNGLKLFTLLHPDDYSLVKEVFKVLLATKGNGGIIEFRYKHKNGHYLIMEAQGNNQLHNPAINAVILTTRDITRRKEKEEERMLLVYELMEKNADLKQFSYITSHNLRAPLTNLMAICNLLDTEGLTQNDTVELIGAFKISTAKLSDTLNDLIKILIIKDAKSQDIVRVYFEKTLAEVKTSINGLIEMSGAVIHADFANGPSVNFYPAYMESIFLNLLTNSLKYAHPARKPIISIRTQEDGKFVVLTFTDNGIGMNLQRVKSKIFGLYQRFHTNIEGKGIGLYLVHSQVTALGGSITVDSTEGEGTTFVIRFKKELFRGK